MKFTESFAGDGNLHYSILKIQGLEQHAAVTDSTLNDTASAEFVQAAQFQKQELMDNALKSAQARLFPQPLVK